MFRSHYNSPWVHIKGHSWFLESVQTIQIKTKENPIDEKETMTNKMHVLTAEHGNKQ